MTLKLRTFQIGSRRKRGEGLRLGTVRYIPRGVRAKDYAKLDLFDTWLPVLAPSRALLTAARKKPLTAATFKHFAQRYEREMRRTDAKQAIRLVALMAQRTPLAIGCYCADERFCHRSILVELIRDAARTA